MLFSPFPFLSFFSVVTESLMSVNDTAALAGLADGDEEAEAGAGGNRSGGAGDDIEALLGMDAAPTSTT